MDDQFPQENSEEPESQEEERFTGKKRKLIIAIGIVSLAVVAAYILYPLFFKTGEYLAKGERLIKEKRYAEAADVYGGILKDHPKTAKAWMNMGFALDNLGNPIEAIKYFDNAISLNPKLSRVWFYKANSLSGIGRFDEAMQCYDQALKIDPKSSGAWGNKAYLLRRLKRYDEARDALNKYIKLEAKNLKIDITEKLADDAVNKVTPLIEQYTGFKFKKKIEYKFLLPHEAGQIAKKKILRQLVSAFPGVKKDILESQAAPQSELYSEIMPSFYDYSDGILYIIPDNFQVNMLMLKPAKGSIVNIFNLLMAHDLALIIDDQNYGVSKRILNPASQESMDVFEGITEGHALSAARYASGKLGSGSKDFEIVSGMVCGYLGEASPFDQAANQFVSIRYKNIFLKGEEFVKLVNEREGMKGIEKILTNPPQNGSVLTNPVSYYEQSGLKPQDYIDLLKVLEQMLGDKKEWAGQAVKLNEALMRKKLSITLPAKEIENIFKNFDEGYAISYLRKNVALVSVGLLKFRNKEGANKFMDAEMRSVKNDWDRVKESGSGSLQVLRDKNLLISNADRSVIREAVLSPTPNQRKYVLSVFAATDNYLCEFSSINQPFDEEAVKNMIYGIFMNLEKKK